VQDSKSFAGFHHGAGSQFHLTVTLEKALVGLADSLMSDHSLAADDQHSARLVQIYDGFDIAAIESVEEKGMEF
jgi:ribosomal protein S12 methylthiotransferase accessory factor YcaO